MKLRLRRAGPPSPGPTLSRQNPSKNVTATELEVDNWAISEFVRLKIVPLVGTHPFPLNELMLIISAVCRFQPPQIFDWGTHIGKSARIFYETAAHYRIDTEIHSTDLPDTADHPEHPRSQRGAMVAGLSSVSLHQGDGATVSLDIWRSGGRRPAPLFLLDGDHAYDTVARELELILSEVPDAIVLVHDSFYQSAESGYNVGPHDAIATAMANHSGAYRVLRSGMGLPGLALLYPDRRSVDRRPGG